MKRICILILSALMLSVTFNCTVTSAEPGQKPDKQVAIVIDDFGNGMNGTDEMLKLPVPFTAAIMPFMPTTKQDAEAAYELGHDVIVHLPMEPLRGKRSWLGPGAVTTGLSDEEIRNRVEAAIDDVPHAVGMNNHMGSKATANVRIMRIVLEVCKERGLFFLDSRTTHKSVIPQLAADLDIPVLTNHVFLDDIYSEAHIVKQLGKLRKELDAHVACVAIGHVGPPGKKTAAAIRGVIPAMKMEAEFVRLSELLPSHALEKQILP